MCANFLGCIAKVLVVQSTASVRPLLSKFELSSGLKGALVVTHTDKQKVFLHNALATFGYLWTTNLKTSVNHNGS